MCEKLIRADALLETITKMAAEGFSAENVGRIIVAITDAPSGDAVEVVRCKDCKYGVTPYGDEHDGWIECTNIHGRPLFRDDGFCSYGERKDHE